jgi:hypothetical protein
VRKYQYLVQINGVEISIISVEISLAFFNKTINSMGFANQSFFLKAKKKKKKNPNPIHQPTKPTRDVGGLNARS